MTYTGIITWATFAALILHSSQLVNSQEVEDEREFDYMKGSGRGPEDWGNIHEELAMCSNGAMQSPIDLLDKRVEIVRDLGRFKRSYKPSNATLRNRGHDIMLRWVNGAGTIKVNGTEYVLKQCHWHSPSEHTLNGRGSMVHEVFTVRKKGELQGLIVCSFTLHFCSIWRCTWSTRRRIIKYVVGIMYRIGRPDSFLREVRTVSIEQVRLLREAVHDSAESNAINERPIHLYSPKVLPTNQRT